MKDELIEISVAYYNRLTEIKEEVEAEEQEKAEAEREAHLEELKKLMFEYSKTCGSADEIVSKLIYSNGDLLVEFVGDIFMESNVLALELVEDTVYEDPISGMSNTIEGWIDFFRLDDEEGYREELYARCEKLYNDKQALLNQLQDFINKNR